MLDNPDPHPTGPTGFPLDCESVADPAHDADCKTNDHFGSKITSHDVNSDGYVDLVVGGLNEPDSVETRGELWVFLGTGAGIDPQLCVPG
ncbi:MAG: hypothetical protein H6825_02350 [Planctomycetes bacterium]|nr:hypothetical protein [Planctomycetota bacterium]